MARTRITTTDLMTDTEIRAALSERDVLLLTLLGEARGEELEGRVAVGCVIRNRMADDRWPDSIRDVCLQRFQFSCWNGGDLNYKALMEHARLLTNDHAVRSNFVPTSIDKETRWLADGLLSGIVRDRVGGANHYLTRAKWETDPPKWAKDQRPSAFVGRHCFFKL